MSVGLTGLIQPPPRLRLIFAWPAAYVSAAL